MSRHHRRHGRPRAFDFLMAARFFARVPLHLRHPLTTEKARHILDERLRCRETLFIGQVRRSVFHNPASPYLPLLRRAGVEHGDLERMVLDDGIEATLSRLLREGVYLTVDEFKGRKDVVRGNLTFATGPEMLRNPNAAYHLPVSSGGSRSRGTPVFVDLRFVRGCSVDCALFLDAWGGRKWLKATWEVPGAGARFRLMKYGSFGNLPVRWFSQVDPADPGLNRIFRWNTNALVWSSRMSGRPIPRATYAPPPAPDSLIEWLEGVRASRQTPHLLTFPSSAVALCRRALELGRDISGTRLTLGGEATTQAKLAAVREAGCIAMPRYGSMECGPVGYGCLSPERPDDVHILRDLHAVIRAGEGTEFPADAILVTSLHPHSPFTFLNVSMGDAVTVSNRSCDCALEKLGWRQHLTDIRSYEKLTGGGMTFFGPDVIRILEEVMPARFGGGPTDYQLIEEESAGGVSKMKLAINPTVGAIEAAEAADVFLEALGRGSVVDELMERMWRESNMLEVVRQAPTATQSGKVLHLSVRPVADG